MSHPSEVLFDREPIDAAEDAYQMKYVRLAYESLEDLPQRIFKQVRSEDHGATGISRPVVTELVGLVVLAEPVDGRLDEIRFDVEFGQAPELLAGLTIADLIPIDDVLDEMSNPRLAKRRQYATAAEESLMRRAEGWDCSEDDVIQERIALDPTGSGECGIPPITDEGRIAPGVGADQITKVYLVDRKEPILIYGELENVSKLLCPIEGEGVPDIWIQFQRVNADAIVSSDDIVINPAFVVSLQSERA